ncbi:MAG: hypothetical protein HZC11_06300 [Nitrospirae bacterium]|nr:hypothetical protein [Nitrospirota bacterium]
MVNSNRTLIFLLFTFHCLLFTAVISCGRRGDPAAIEPFPDVAVVKDLKAFFEAEGTRLTWGMPKDKDFPVKAIKGFLIFRAEVPGEINVSPEKCECEYKSIDFVPSGKDVSYEYLDKKAVKGLTYLYKVVVMDKTNRMGKDSNIVYLTDKKSDMQKVDGVPVKTPTGLTGVYTQKNIVLAWDEIHGARLYRIYRSAEVTRTNGFVLAGEAVTPVFTDKNVEPSKKYYYRVTAFKDSESLPSNMIEVATEVH